MARLPSFSARILAERLRTALPEPHFEYRLYVPSLHRRLSCCCLRRYENCLILLPSSAEALSNLCSHLLAFLTQVTVEGLAKHGHDRCGLIRALVHTLSSSLYDGATHCTMSNVGSRAVWTSWKILPVPSFSQTAGSAKTYLRLT